ncbi:hypothetical protein GW17_00045562, partial [Ensete ventricosum]
GPRVTSSGQESLAVKVPHAARTLGCMGDFSHGRELTALGHATFSHVESNIYALGQGCKQPLAML